ncbi:hypothetical protein MPTK1_8g10800 [Marchantia polymorpha subsp. ruderalis]|uniref:Acyl-CoA-binding domain-containing protein n=2 Tax=Marchantia polymorpha TaxID=3197 RepID=A0A176W2C6_MARPO|nr:hypothetical protein AXG93_3310s1200 [Marchantia polymorpha subsp. ruderalis]PTQ47377.1 hypothetical protein MARPO_0008s0142 [Marchantia polymorpha]BBN19454.1 hypothetical protein Mp_8g10800 [Marchantia polymorpha subsp. ruderalis]|eukprot:PTQ47377.1 hypothetical protein MARPO_0008s0142 [Marchantia polymorpha]
MESMQISRDKVRNLKREGFAHLKLFIKSRSGKKDSLEDSSSTTSTPSPDVRSVEKYEEGTSFRKKLVEIEHENSWIRIHTRGNRPPPRFHHAAAVVGRKLLIIGGETGSELLNDVQMFHLGKLSWSSIGVGASAPSKGLPQKTSPAQELPKCKGHSLISWGKTVILIAGQMDPPVDKVTVWSFDLEMDCWTKVATKGEIPSARSGQTVTRAGSILIMFGGEDAKGRKLNDLHILDLKSLMWLPLHTSGNGPSPRTKHIAEMYDDRFLLIFGGVTRSKISNDIFALDFDTMEWSRLKTRGLPPTPRAGHAGVLVGDKWYIVGGESRVPGILETSALNISLMTWSVVAPASPDTVTSHQGLSVVFVQRKEKKFLVAYGGRGTEASSTVQVLYLPPAEESTAPKTLGGLLGVPSTPEPSHSSTPENQQPSRQHGSLPSLLGSTMPCACVNVAKSNLVSVLEHRSSQKSGSGAFVDDHLYDSNSGLIPLRKRYAISQESMRDSFAKRSDSVKSADSVALDTFEGKERQHETAQSIRGDMQSSTTSVDSGLLSAEDYRVSAPSVRPASSVGDVGTLPGQSQASHSRKTRPRKESFRSSEFPDYAETSMSGSQEEQQYTCEQSVAASSSSVDSSISWISAGWPSSSTTTSNRTTPEYEEDELSIVAKLHKADTPEQRTAEVTRLRRHHERKLAASIRKGEIIAGQLAEALRSKDEAERTLQTVLRSRQRAEARLAAALKEQKELHDSLAASAKTREEVSNAAHKTRVHNLKLEHDLALVKAVLEDTQKELHSTRGVLIGERTRAFQLQVELFDVKQKLQTLDPGHIHVPRVQQPIMA